MVYCTECGAEVKNEAKFCANCGTSVLKREKRSVITDPRNLPPPKVMRDKRPINYKAESPEDVPMRHEVPASEIPKDRGQLLHPSAGVIKWGEKTPGELERKQRKQKIIGQLITIPIVIAVVIGIPWMILGYPIWEVFDGGGGGGGASLNFDGTYYGNSFTVTPMGSTSGSGYFDVVDGYVSEGWFQGTVDSSGYFTGTIVVSQGSPAILVTGQFSLTGTFRLSGSGSNTSWYIDAYKI